MAIENPTYEVGIPKRTPRFTSELQPYEEITIPVKTSYGTTFNVILPESEATPDKVKEIIKNKIAHDVALSKV
jgi:hypothetical protein